MYGAECVFIFLCSLAAIHAQLSATFNWAQTGSFGNSSSTCSFPVHNQQQCGSCYAHSAAEVLGSSLCAYTGSPAWLSLSPQHILNVNKAQRTAAYWTSNNLTPCSGGDPALMIAFMHNEAIRGGGLSTCQSLLVSSTSAPSPSAFSVFDQTSCYGGSCDVCMSGCMPYTEANCVGTDQAPVGVEYFESQCNNGMCICEPFSPSAGCASSSPASEGVLFLPADTSFTFKIFDDDDMLFKGGRSLIMEWLQNKGPLSVLMHVGHTFTVDNTASLAQCSDCSSPTMNHAVTLVGWTELPSQSSPSGSVPVWIIQNSWGAAWGDAGFFYVPFDDVGPNATQFNIQYPVGVYVYNTLSTTPGPSSTTPPPKQHDSSWIDYSEDDAGAISSISVSDSFVYPFDYLSWGLCLLALTGASLPGSSLPIHQDSPHAKAVISYVVNHLNNKFNTSHNVTLIEAVDRQIVNGIQYASSIVVMDTHSSTLRRVQSTLWTDSDSNTTRPLYRVLTLHVFHPVSLSAESGTASSSSLSSGSKAGLGIGLGIGLFALVAMVILVVAYKQRISNSQIYRKGVNPVLEEHLLPSDSTFNEDL